MTQKVYRTAQGKTVDLGALMLQNENTRAVGNMKVNARGDLVDGWNRPIDSRTHQVQKQYERQVTNVRDEPVVSSHRSSTPEPFEIAKSDRYKPTKAPKDVVVSEPVPQDPGSQGLAAAIAKARQIKQEPTTRLGRGSDDDTRMRRI